jgi:hypothetical protein
MELVNISLILPYFVINVGSQAYTALCECGKKYVGQVDHTIKIKKGKLSLYLIMLSSTLPQRHMGEWKYSSIILDLGTRWR